MEYWPTPLVTTERAFSMSAGLDASTVTPGSTAPDASREVPTIDACAHAVAGIRISVSAKIAFNYRSIVIPPKETRDRRDQRERSHPARARANPIGGLCTRSACGTQQILRCAKTTLRAVRPANR